MYIYQIIEKGSTLFLFKNVELRPFSKSFLFVCFVIGTFYV